MSNAVAQIVLTHGAGASCQSDFMQQLAQALTAQQLQVTLFDFVYMRQRQISGKKRPPPKAAVLIAELAELLATTSTALPLFIGGKSMGGRIASMLAADTELTASIAGVFAYGYPFHPPKKAQWRIEHFAQLAAPLHIIQGERDPFGYKAEVSELSWPNVTTHWLTSADHDFKALKSSGLTQQDLINQAALFTRRSIDAIISKN